MWGWLAEGFWGKRIYWVAAVVVQAADRPFTYWPAGEDFTKALEFH